MRPPLKTIETRSFISIAPSEIFVHMDRAEGYHHLVSFNFTCDNESHRPRTKRYSATFILVEHNMPPAGHGFAERSTLQQWFSGYFRRKRTDAPQCQLCRAPCPRSLLSVTLLLWIWIDIPREGDRRFTLSTTLTLERESGPNVHYTLTGIIYVGGTLYGPFQGRS